MKRTKLIDRVLPKYTKGEEIFNMTSHILGGVLGIVATVLCVVFAGLNHNVYGIVGGAIYGTSLIVLYTMSSIYHGLNPKRHSKKVFQVLDHCTIFFLIAGSYTPLILCNIRPIDVSTGWWLFGIVWAVAILGIVLASIDIKKYSKFSMVCYLVVGWCIIFKADLLLQALGKTGTILLLAGGIAYTVGTIFYKMGKNHKYMHFVFHLFTLLGSVLHFFCILFYAM